MAVEELDTPLQSLTIILLKNCESADSALKTASGLRRHQLGDIGTLYVKPPKGKPPSWARFFRNHLADFHFGRVASPRAVLFVSVDGRHFAITFGTGRFLLDPLKIEQRFGLLVALNAIDEDRVRCMDKQSFDRLATQSRIQASRDASPSDFGLDIERDLLRAVTGIPRGGKAGELISGLDALHVIARVDIEGLRTQLSWYLTKHGEKRYRRAFPWVDQISEIRDQTTRARLDHELVERLNSNDTALCWMAPEHIVDWETIAFFQFGIGQLAARHQQLGLDSLLHHLKRSGSLTPERLEHTRVLALRADDTPVHEWSAKRCLYAEVVENGRAYILNAGKWYSIARGFVEEVDAAVREIPTCDLALPDYKDESEGRYNERVHGEDPKRFALTDFDLIPYGGGRSKIEFCDLFSVSHDVVHVKRYGGSSVFSHFFNQALVSGEMFRTDLGFRREVNVRLPATHKLADPSDPPADGRYRVVFAVIDGPGTCEKLPFFSRVTLKNTYRQLLGYGYRVAVTHIPLEAMFAKTNSFREKKMRRFRRVVRRTPPQPRPGRTAR